MTKQHFFMRLIPPRPSFPGDMTEEEGRLMQEHATYTRAHFDAGRVLIYGPVLAASGTFGMAVLEVDDDAEAKRIMEDDPSVRAGMNRYELAPIRVAAARGTRGQ